MPRLFTVNEMAIRKQAKAVLADPNASIADKSSAQLVIKRINRESEKRQEAREAKRAEAGQTKPVVVTQPRHIERIVDARSLKYPERQEEREARERFLTALRQGRIICTNPACPRFPHQHSIRECRPGACETPIPPVSAVAVLQGEAR